MVNLLALKFSLAAFAAGDIPCRTKSVYWTYREVGKVIYKQEELKNMLERIKKEKKVSKDNEGMSIKKNNKK